MADILMLRLKSGIGFHDTSSYYTILHNGPRNSDGFPKLGVPFWGTPESGLQYCGVYSGSSSAEEEPFVPSSRLS